MHISEKQLNEVMALIDASTSILLACHLGPDADSIGSNLAFYFFLEKQGKMPTIVSSDPLPESMDFLPGYHQIRTQKLQDVDQDKFDLLVSLDSGSWPVITDATTRESWTKPVVVIDHHPSNTKFGTVNIIEPKLSSTGELLYNFFKELGFQTDAKIAECLLVGIFSDTGGFCFPNTTAETFLVVADLIDKGATLSEIVFNHDQRVSLPTMEYWGDVLKNMKLNRKLKYAWSVVSKEKMQKIGTDKRLSGGAATMFLGNIEGTDFAFLLTEQEDGQIFGSFRSRTQVNSSVFSIALGGGGHLAASGFTLPAKYSLTEAEKLVHETIKKHYKEIVI